MILYIGNKLSKYGNTPTSVETLGELLVNDIDIITVSDKNNKLHRLFDMLFHIIKYKHKIDYILIDTYSTSNFYYALLSSMLSKYVNIPYIPILHGGSLEDRLKYSKRMSKFIFDNAYLNVSPSNYLKHIFQKYGYDTLYIPNNLEIDIYPYLKREVFKPKLLYVRAFSEVYNPSMALDALKLLKNDYKEATLCMVGPDKDGTLEKVKQKAKELDLEKDVIFTGKLSKEEWIALSKDYDIFINTTNVDNTPVSVMEAMALGLVVVSTNVGGLPYLIEDKKDGILVDRDDAFMMSDKIKEILTEQNIAKKLTKNARAKVESFDWSIVKKEWLKILGEPNNVS